MHGLTIFALAFVHPPVPALALTPVQLRSRATTPRNDEQQLQATLPSTPQGSPSSELEGAAGKVVPAKSQPPPPSLVAQASASVLTNIPIIAAVSALGYLLTMALAGMTGPVAGGVKLIYAGAIAGIISRTCCAPLEMVSTVMMCRGDECTSMWDELQKTWKKEGLTGLFRGNVANCPKPRVARHAVPRVRVCQAADRFARLGPRCQRISQRGRAPLRGRPRRYGRRSDRLPA